MQKHKISGFKSQGGEGWHYRPLHDKDFVLCEWLFKFVCNI